MRRMPWLTVAPNGARPGKANHPAVPVTLDELAACAAECHAAGAEAIHLHVRDAAGGHVLDAELFNRAAAAVERATGGAMWVQATTEAVGRYSAADQRALLPRLRVPAVSLGLRELIPDASEEAAAAEALAALTGRGVSVQYFLYEPAEIPRFADLVRRGVVPDVALDVLFALGHYTIGDTETEVLVAFLSAWADSGLAGRAEWAACAFGRTETRALAAVLALGGKARVGFENSMLMADGSRAPDNAARVAEIVALARAMGHEAIRKPEAALQN